MRLDNVHFWDRITPGEFVDLLGQADVGLVNLNRRFTIPNYPSKVLDYFEAELPVLASLDQSTDFGKMLDEAGAGLWSTTGDLPAYRRNLDLLAADSDLRRAMGQRGRAHLERCLTVEGAYRTIVQGSPRA
jgi:glycosyltransferase involved in cell wall biosynthesis